jgi:predicted phosphodiesterase
MKLGIISDIHENVEMLEKALSLSEFHKCDELVCLGDIVGFDVRFYKYNSRRSAKTCVRLVKANCRWVVPGNHDLFAAGRLPEYTNGFDYPDGWFMMAPHNRKKASAGKVWCYDQDASNDLGDDEISFLKELPEYIISEENGASCLFSHYVYPDLTGSTTRYVERNHQLKELWEFMKNHNVNYSFSGHSHTIFAGFAYRGTSNGARKYLKAIHSIPSDRFNLGNEQVMVLLPPLSGEKGRRGFAIFDTDTLKLNIISIN